MLAWMWRKSKTILVLEGVKIGAITMKVSMEFLKNLEIYGLYDPAVPPLGS